MIKSKYTSGLTAYLESLTVSQGRLAGQRFTALPWQRRFVRGAFCEGVQSAALSVARGNGKTSLLSAIACAYLDGPLAVPRGEVVIVASSFLQARLSFEHVLAFLGDKLGDRDRWRTWDTAQTALIEDRKTGSRVRCIGSDAASCSWSSARPGPGRRTSSMADFHQRQHEGCAGDGFRQTTSFKIRGARHQTGRP